MKRIILSFIASTAIFVSFVIPTTTVSAAEFISIGTGGPTGVYFQTGKPLHASYREPIHDVRFEDHPTILLLGSVSPESVTHNADSH